MKKVIFAGDFVDIDRWPELPVYYIAGPCQGCWDFQYLLIETIEKMGGEDAIFVHPRRYPDSHPLQRFRLQGDPAHFPDQYHGEVHYINEALVQRKRGAVVCWGCAEDPQHPRDDGHPYAKDTHNELSKWCGELCWSRDLRLVVGAEEEFRDLRYQQRAYEVATNGTFVFHKTLEETARAGVLMTRREFTRVA